MFKKMFLIAMCLKSLTTITIKIGIKYIYLSVIAMRVMSLSEK
jgi:hypothetical protein